MTPLFVSSALLIAGALLALVLARAPRLGSALCVAFAVSGCVLGAVFSLSALADGVHAELQIHWAVPFAALRVGLDPLSAFFLVPLFLVGAMTAIYGRGYLLEHGPRALPLPTAAFNLLLASMVFVLIARNAVLFLFSWEVMSLTAYLLISFEHRQASVRRAGWVYLVATHLGVVCLILMFLLLAAPGSDFGFDVLSAHALERRPAIVAPLLLGTLGFGVKAGLVPLHVWLPEAHAAAPSHVSALMSAVLIKLGVYGMLRLVLLLGGPPAWWGPMLLAFGMLSATLGIALALYQRDIKRVLAYSSVENVGIVALGLGVGFWAQSKAHPTVALLGFSGALLHLWNHALMKSTLFMAAGSVLHGCHTKDIERLGGLLRRMPLTATAMLISGVAIAGLPPLNGFVGEWLLYAGLLNGSLESSGVFAIALFMAILVLSSVGAMAVLCFVRLTGIALLGEARSPEAEKAHESPSSMSFPLVFSSLLLGVMALRPQSIRTPLANVVQQLGGSWPAAEAIREATVSRLSVLNCVLVAAIVTLMVLTRVYLRLRGSTRQLTWDCGYAAPTPRMQYTGRAFSEFFTANVLPVRLSPKLIERPPAGLFPASGQLESQAHDPIARGVYEPFFARWADRFARLRWMQQGLLHVYVIYILVALLAALAFSALPTLVPP